MALKFARAGNQQPSPRELGKVQRPSRKGVGVRNPEAPSRLTNRYLYGKTFSMWNRRYERCVSCGRTDRRYMAKGKCSFCYLADYRTVHADEIAESKKAWRQKNYRYVLSNQRITREQKHFDGKRDAVLKRDGYRCVRCGSKSQVIVHHKDGNGRGSEKPNNSMRNLETLCRTCHQREHRILDRWSKDFDYCQRCGTIERRHNAKGLCWKCYHIVHNKRDDMVRASASTEES